MENKKREETQRTSSGDLGGSNKTREGSSQALDKHLPSRIESLCGHMQFSGRQG